MNSLRRVYLKAVMFITAFTFLQAQSDFLGHTIHFTSRERPQRNLKQEEYRAALVYKYAGLFDNREYLDEFVEDMVRHKISFLNSNHEYENLTEITNYVKKIVEHLELEKLINKPVEIKVVRDPDLNAYVYEDGIVYVNIGLLANVDSEAEIAAIIAHEMGHILHQHVYKRFLLKQQFLRKQESAIVLNSVIGGGGIASAVNRKNYSKDLVEQEEEADLHAFEVIRESSYDYGAFKTTYTQFSDLETKYENTLSYRKPWFYFKTHPNSSDRVKSANKFAKENLNKSKFLVDSVLFYKIKKQAIDESINLYFEQLDFHTCLEMAFKQHLYSPEDPFYLFYITECTRRIMATDVAYPNTLFISGRYKDGYCKNLNGLHPKCITSDGKIKPMDYRLNTSIFNKLQGPMLSITEFEYKTLVNRNFIEPDTIPFLTYKDAYTYFTQLNRNLNYSFINYEDNRKNFVPLPTRSINHLPDKKTYFTHLPTIVKEYSISNPDTGKVLWILFDFGYVSQTSGIFSSKISINENESYDKLISYYKNAQLDMGSGSDLNFEEYNHVVYYLYAAKDKLKSYKKSGAMRKRKSVDYNMSEIIPELYPLLYNNNYKAVVFSSIDISVQTSKALGMSATMETWNVNNYWFDARSNKINCYAGNIGHYPSNPLFLNSNTTKNLEEAYFNSILKTITLNQK